MPANSPAKKNPHSGLTTRDLIVLQEEKMQELRAIKLIKERYPNVIKESTIVEQAICESLTLVLLAMCDSL